MKQTSNKSLWQYFRAGAAHANATISLSSIRDFIRYAELHSVKAVMLLQGPEASADNSITHFALLHNGSLIQQAAEGYQTLEDFISAAATDFLNALDYYDAMQRGISTYADYKLIQEANIGELSVMEQMKKGGYVTGFERLRKLMETDNDNRVDLGVISNPHELYLIASERGFPDYESLELAWKIGFAQYDEYLTATHQGYPDAASYEDAVKRGIMSYADYQFAEEHHLRDAADAATFLNLSNSKGGIDMPHDQKVLLSFLSRLEEGKRVSIYKLEDHFAKALEEYHYPDTGTLPLWFTKSLHTHNDLVEFLAGCDEPKQYGTYHSDGEFFEVAPLKKRHVVIDGSNVAYNSVLTREKTTPHASNMLKLVRFLKAKGFENISIIADASLKHKLPDEEVLDELIGDVEYIVAPAEKSADQFIIQYVKLHQCLLVSNDTFREWKVRDPWVATNIDYYRLTFLVKEDSVLMPDLT